MVSVTVWTALADEGGVSFWLPGTYGSLASVPAVPGWSFSTFNYYNSVSASKGADFLRGGGTVAGVNSRIDFLFVNPAYVFATPVLGGQASAGMDALIGPNTTSAFGTVTGPGGLSLSGSRSDTEFGVGDLYPTRSLRWSQGVKPHDLPHRRHSGRPLQCAEPGQSRHRPRRGRRGQRLHLF
jgi:hypothetical protein